MQYLKWIGCLLLLGACSTYYTPPENALDAGRQFAEAVYKGNFKRAGDLIVPNAENKQLLEQRFEKNYHERDNTTRNQLSQASLQILDINNNLKDSSLFIHFTNAYTGKPAFLKVIRNAGTWLVDLKYTFAGNL